MPYPSLAVAVVMERTQLQNRWQPEKWEPVGVLPDSESEGAAPRLLHEDARSAQWLHPGFTLELFHDESEATISISPRRNPLCSSTGWMKPARACQVGDGELQRGRAHDGRRRARRRRAHARRMDSWLEHYVQKHYKPEPKKKRIRPPSFKGARRDDR